MHMLCMSIAHVNICTICTLSTFTCNAHVPLAYSTLYIKYLHMFPWPIVCVTIVHEHVTWPLYVGQYMEANWSLLILLLHIDEISILRIVHIHK